jgi:hypothetical protein
MYPGKGTYIPTNQNGMNDRSPKEQAALDQQVEEFIAWKKETQLEEYEAAYAAHLEEGGTLESLDMFILAFPEL